MIFPYTSTEKLVFINTLENGELIIKLPVDCFPNWASMPIVIRSDEDVTELTDRLNEWLKEGPITVDKFGVYTQIVVAISRYWVG